MTEQINPLFKESSGVSLTVTPSKAILAEIDNFCEFSKQSGGSSLAREEALLFFAHSGITTWKMVDRLARAAKRTPGPIQAQDSP